MPYIADEALETLLSTLPSDTKKILNNIISGKATHQVRCMSELCNGEVIAYLQADGLDAHQRSKYSVVPATQAVSEMKLLAFRKRLDGFIGFQCKCGNDSRRAPHEQDSIDKFGNPPTRQGLQDIYERIQKSPPNYPELSGRRLVDGFSIERVAA